MVRLSVNVNKVATLRNARGGRLPDVLEAVDVCVAAGAPGITVHPRADERHITRADVRAIAARLRQRAPGVEYNIEGDPRPDLLDLVTEVAPATEPFNLVLLLDVSGSVEDHINFIRKAARDFLVGVFPLRF